MVATNVYRFGSWNDLQLLRAGCACMNPDHDHNIMITVEREDNFDDFISVSIESNLEHCAWQDEWHGNLFQRLWVRLKAAVRVMFTGHLSISSTFYFQSEDQVRDYIQAINDSLIQVKTNATRSRIMPAVSETVGNN